MSMFNTNINCANESFVKIETNNSSVYDILDKNYVFTVPGHQFMPSYKRGVWDGKIRLFDRKTKKIYRGLLGHIYKTLKKHDIGNLRVTGFNKPKDKTAEFHEWLESIKDELPFYPTDYQIDGVLRCINKERTLIESPTSSGKSFIFYLTIRFLIDSREIEKNVLFVVPTIMLVDQIIENFEEFGAPPGLIQKLGPKKTIQSKVAVSTWQSIYKQDKAWFDNFNAICVDEVHLATGNSIKSIMENSENSFYRIGMTGTMKDLQVDRLVLIGLFGPVFKTISTRELMDIGFAAELNVVLKRLGYERIKEAKPEIFKTKPDYQNEVEMVLGFKARDRRIYADIEKYSDKNILCVYRFKKHGIRFYEGLKEKYPDREIYHINGDTNKEERSKIRIKMDNTTGAVLVASYGTLSLGVSIKSLDIGMLISPVKASIRLAQTVGRMLRTSDTKTKATLYDYWDDIIFGNGRKKSYCKSHAELRLAKYEEIGFAISEEDKIL